MMNYFEFDTIEEMEKAMEEGRKKADKAVKPWQKELKENDYFVQLFRPLNEILPIFGHILPIENEEDQLIMSQLHMENIRLCKCYSFMCPEGEIGDIHISTIWKKISREMFEEGQKLNFDPLIVIKWVCEGTIIDME